MPRATQCTECEDGWVHYATTIQEEDKENGVHEVIKPSLFLTRDRKYKIANISDNGAGVCHSCAHRVEKVHKTPEGINDFVPAQNRVCLIVKDLDTGEIHIPTVQVDYWHFFKTEDMVDEEGAERILKGGLVDVNFTLSRDEVIARYLEKVEESGMSEEEYLAHAGAFTPSCWLPTDPSEKLVDPHGRVWNYPCGEKSIRKY